MTAPSIRVYIGFGSTWQTEPASITWTDVTDYVLQADRIATRRGATAASGQVQPGVADLVLKNDDRRFDPTYEDGDYFADLVPGVPVWIFADSTYSDIYSDDYGLGFVSIWRGTIARWPQRYVKGSRHARVPLQCYDGFDKLSRAKIPRSVLEVELLADNPVGYWPLQETTGDTLADISGNRHHGIYQPLTTARSAEVALSDAVKTRMLDLEGGSERGHISEPTLALTATPFVVEAIVSSENTSTGTSNSVFYRSGDGNPLVGMVLQVWDDGYLMLNRATDSGYIINSNGLDFTKPTHVAYRRAGATQKAYVNGVVDNDETFSAGSFPNPSRPGLTLGGVENADVDTGFLGSVAHVAQYDYDIGTTRIAAHYEAAFAPLDGQRVDERIAWILDELGWPTNLRDLEAAQTTLGPATFVPGDKALEYLRVLERSEDGRLFIDATGNIRFVDRYWRFLDSAATSSQFTFTDASASTGYAEFELDLDDELLVNVARVTRRGGVEQVASSAASIVAYGEAELQLSDLAVQTDNEALSLAEWIVATRSTPLPRVPKIRVPLHAYSAANQATVLGLELGERVTCVRTPPVGDAISLEFVIDGIENELGNGEWWWTAFVSPVPEETLSPFIWGTSTWGGTDAWAH